MEKVVDFVRVETRNSKWILDQFESGSLIVDNSFQRKFVWLEKHQISLIETILKNMPIPEIYLWEKETDPLSGRTILSIIDGQQRLTSLYKYLKDEFKLKDSHLDDSDPEYANKKFSELSPSLKSAIWRYSFSIRFVKEEVSREQIIKMFLRLNNTSMTLNPQELRNAEFGGKFINLAVELSEIPFWEEYSIFTMNEIRRMIDIQFVSSILIFIRLGIEEETTQSNINKVYDTYNHEYEEYEEDKSLFLDLISEVEIIINEDDVVKNFLKKKTHLYTLMVAAYYFKRRYGGMEEQQIENYKKFIEAYEDTSNKMVKEYFGEESIKDFAVYRKLSTTGTQAKRNRMNRFNILKKYLELAVPNNG